jgi:prefoldin beta subunit
MAVQKKEIENALEELKNIEKGEIFKSVGPILIETNKVKIEKELKELQEDLDVRIQSLEKQEKILKERIKENQKKFQGLLPETGQGG